MNISPELLIGAGTLITVLSTTISSWVVSRRAARKDEMEALKKQVIDLTTANDNWRIRYDRLYTYVLTLRLVLTDHHFKVPEMPPIDGEMNVPYEAYKKPPSARPRRKDK
jgi:hypothetical protein